MILNVLSAKSFAERIKLTFHLEMDNYYNT